MEFGSFDGGEHGQHSGLDFVEISKVIAMQGACFFGLESFEGL